MLYSTKNIVTVSTTDILKRVNEHDIYSKYIPSYSEPGKKFCSELRQENNPSCCIKKCSNGVYLYKDFTTGEVFNCFTYLQVRFNLGYNAALMKVIRDFELSNLPFRDVSISVSKPFIKEGTNKVIRIKRREYNSCDWNYWGKYFITKDLLDSYNVVPLSNYWIHSDKTDRLELVYSYKKDSPSYSYEFGEGVRKILNPYNTQFKWMSNVPNQYYSGFDQLDYIADKLIITSSMKDVLVWRLLGFNAIAPQSETQKIPSEFIIKLKKRFNEVIINYDNDLTGIKFSRKLEINYGFKCIYVPKEDNIKDISDYIGRYGIYKTKELIKELNI